ncbi:MAG: cobalamin B12-binding domain-containing protein [Hyphomicrobiales bacterium]|nr:cobalamin B12-binding domain-containing protein [Hyphomicrobiales bacterium]
MTPHAAPDPAHDPAADAAPESAPDLGCRAPKVLVTKIGLDGHDRGSRLVAAFLRDAGMEVVYTAPWQSLSAVVNLAIEEDVDVIGVSSLATDHLLLPQLMDRLRAAGMGHVGVVVGGIVPPGDERDLLAAGVARVFHPGSASDDIVAEVRRLTVRARAETEEA